MEVWEITETFSDSSCVLGTFSGEPTAKAIGVALSAKWPWETMLAETLSKNGAMSVGGTRYKLKKVEK